LGQDEVESDNHPMSEGLSDDEPYQVNNPMHDIIMYDGEGEAIVASRLVVLAKVIPLVVGGKKF